MTRAADPLDEFLEGAGSGTELGELLETLGLGIALPAIVIAFGLVVFGVFVHRGAAEEKKLLVRLLGFCGVVSAVGGLIGIVGTATILRDHWLSNLFDFTTVGSLVRLLSGVLMAIGFLGAEGAETWIEGNRQRVGVIGAILGVLSFSLDGHTVTEGNAFLHSAMNTVHVVAAGIWVGGLAALLILSMARRRRGSRRSMASELVRFSTVATFAILFVAATGIAMSLLIVDSLSDYLTTPWGRLLLVKVALVAAAGVVGAYNHYVVVPALDVDPDHPTHLPLARRTVAVEMIILVAVAVLTAFLTRASLD